MSPFRLPPRQDKEEQALSELEQYGIAADASLEELAEQDPEIADAPPEPIVPGAEPALVLEPGPIEHREFHRWRPFLVYMLAFPLPLHIAAGVYLSIRATEGHDVFMSRGYLVYLIAVGVSLVGLIVPLVIAHRSVRRALPKVERKGTLAGALVRFVMTFTLNVVFTAATASIIDYFWRVNAKG